MQSFYSVLPNNVAKLHSKVGVVQVPPTFWAESLTSGGVSDEIVNREGMKRTNRFRVPDPIILVNTFSCPDVSGMVCGQLTDDWWGVGLLCLPVNCFPTFTLWMYLVVAVLVTSSCQWNSSWTFRTEHSYWISACVVGCCGLLLSPPAAWPLPLCPIFPSSNTQLCVGPSLVYFLAAGGTSWLTLYSRGLCFCVVPRQPRIAGALSVCLALSRVSLMGILLYNFSIQDLSVMASLCTSVSWLMSLWAFLISVFELSSPWRALSEVCNLDVIHKRVRILLQWHVQDEQFRWCSCWRTLHYVRMFALSFFKFVILFKGLFQINKK